MSWVEKLEELEAKKAHGQALLSKGAFEQAKRVLGEAKDILDGFYRSQDEVLRAHLDQARSRIVEKNLALGDAYWAEGNHDAAREAYTICLDLASARERDEVMIKLGQIDQREAPSENLEKLGQRVSANPDSAEAIYDFACELAMEGYLPEAIRSLERLIQLTPDDGDVYYRLGNAYLDTGRHDDARRVYHRAIALDFEDKAEIHYRIGLVELASGNRPLARQHFETGLSIRPDHLDALKQLSEMAREDGDHDRAHAYLEKVLEADPEDAQTCADLGDLNQALGRREQAIKWWLKATEVDPEGEAAEYAREKLSEAELAAESAEDDRA